MSLATFDSQQFRRTLSRFATGVTVVTARTAQGLPVGLTCNSFTSLSLEPPLVQWSIGKNSRSHSVMATAEHFAVHVLDASQDALSRQFAARQENRFSNVPLEVGLYELPLLTRYHARFECATYSRHEGGDHTIIVGRVLRLSEQEGAPLIFYRGDLSTLSPDP
jgi:3-hydroxy-9,10-secoandrosta-1,3,5(10)-triene-9,17-dione monooxygenase reductase component